MQFSEPSVMITDFLLGVWTLFFAFKLFRHGSRRKERHIELWAMSLFFTGFAAILGGIHHGFKPFLSNSVLAAIWKTTLYSVSAASMSMFLSVVKAEAAGTLRQALYALVILKFSLFIILESYYGTFKYVIYDYVLTMIPILVLQIYVKVKRNEACALWVIYGIVTSFAGAAIQQSGFSLHQYFTHNDIYHIIQMGAIYLLYRGGRLMCVRRPGHAFK